MKEMLVINNNVYAEATGGGVIASADDMNDLLAGAIAIFDESGVVVDPLNPNAGLLGDRVYMAVGLPGDASPYLTSLIDRASFEYAITPYSAPTAKIMYVGEDGAAAGDLNLPNPLVIGTTATIVVWDKSKRREEFNKTSQVYNYVIKTGDVALDIVTGLVAEINDNSKSIVTAAAVGVDGGIILTGDVAGVDFAVTVQGILQYATLTNAGGANVHSFGHGTYEQMKEAEIHALVRRGNLNSFTYTNELWSLPSNLAIGGTYDVVAANWRNATQDSLQTLQPTYKKELLIVVLSTAAVAKAAIVDILAAM